MIPDDCSILFCPILCNNVRSQIKENNKVVVATGVLQHTAALYPVIMKNPLLRE